MKIVEGFEVGDLKFVLEPIIHIDEFSSKLGKDDKNTVISFLVNDKNASADLCDFFETGYDWVIDCDTSTSEVKPGSWLVFLEMARNRRIPEHLMKIVSDLSAASQIPNGQWKFRYMKGDQKFPLTVNNLKKIVPLSPKSYRDQYQKPLEQLQVQAGVQSLSKNGGDANDIKVLKHAAGLNV
jgi:hypothetical protein